MGLGHASNTRLDTRRRGFTLIELLVVIIIVAILIGITFTIAAAVTRGGAERQTRDVIRVGEAAIQTYYTDVGDAPPAFVQGPSPDASGLAVYPVIDGVDMSDGQADRRTVNSMGLFMLAARQAGLGDLFEGVPATNFAVYDGDQPVIFDGTNDPTRAGDAGNQPELPTLLDAWGRPLRFVHPRFDGVFTSEALTATSAIDFDGQLGTVNLTGSDFDLPSNIDSGDLAFTQVRRNSEGGPADADSVIGDSDGGVCVNRRPYIYSAGSPLPGALATAAGSSADVFDPAQRAEAGGTGGSREGDNVYGSVTPTFPDFDG